MVRRDPRAPSAASRPSRPRPSIRPVEFLHLRVRVAEEEVEAAAEAVEAAVVAAEVAPHSSDRVEALRVSKGRPNSLKCSTRLGGDLRERMYIPFS